MQLYTDVSYELARVLTGRYSTSFSLSSRLFGPEVRPHIYAIYGLVRIADEIVDTYKGADAGAQLERLETETYEAISSGYSVNPIVHAFAAVARQFGISRELIAPFFASMRSDLTEQKFDQHAYDAYIYGSAEVIGLMCLRIFVQGDDRSYDELKKGARSLGAAYQKINFLRDFKTDYEQLGRVYFPEVTFENFDDAAKNAITSDIERDLRQARASLKQLPPSSRRAVTLSIYYYQRLLDRLTRTPAQTIRTTRLRLPNAYKLWLYAAIKIGAIK